MYSCTFSVNSRSCISSTQTFVESVTVQGFYRNLFTGEIFLFSLWLISWPLDFQDEIVLPKLLLSFLPIPPTRSTIVSVRTTKAISQRCWILTFTIWFGRINIRSLALAATRFRDKLCGIHWYSKCAEWSAWIWKLSSFFFFWMPEISCSLIKKAGGPIYCLAWYLTTCPTSLTETVLQISLQSQLIKRDINNKMSHMLSCNGYQEFFARLPSTKNAEPICLV